LTTLNQQLKPGSKLIATMPNFEDLLPFLFIASTSILFLMIILFFIHRRNNKKHLRILEEKLYDLPHTANQQNKQFDTFKQGLQQLINDLSKRIKSNEHRLADIINQLDEMQSKISSTEDKTNPKALIKKDLSKDQES